MAIPHDLNFKMYLPATGEQEVQHKKTNPVNGASFTSSDTHCEFRIGGNQANKFVDGNSSFSFLCAEPMGEPPPTTSSSNRVSTMRAFSGSWT